MSISRPTLSRIVAAAGDEVSRVGHTRATQYLATRAVAAVGRKIEIFRVDESGRVHPLGLFHTIYGRGAVVEFTSGRVAQYPDVPWFLDDIRPQGFLGSVFLRRHPDLDLPRLDQFAIFQGRAGGCGARGTGNYCGVT